MKGKLLIVSGVIGVGLGLALGAVAVSIIKVDLYAIVVAGALVAIIGCFAAIKLIAPAKPVFEDVLMLMTGQCHACDWVGYRRWGARTGVTEEQSKSALENEHGLRHRKCRERPYFDSEGLK